MQDVYIAWIVPFHSQTKEQSESLNLFIYSPVTLSGWEKKERKRGKVNIKTSCQTEEIEKAKHNTTQMLDLI